MLEGAEGMTPQDLKIPVVKIVQGTSKMDDSDAHLGHWYNSITGEFKAGLEVVILSSKHTRALFRRMDEADADKPECLSRDCITGTVHGACNRCEFNAQIHPDLWQKDLGTGQAPKRCNLGYALMLLLVEDGLPGIFTAQKSNVNPIKIVNTILVGRKSPLFGATFLFTTVRKIEGQRKWYELSAKVARWHTPEEIAQYRTLSQSLKTASFEVIDEETTEPVPPPADDEPPAPPLDSYEGGAPF
ncbi:MAG: hypothetical protein V2A73_11880 [Pseudomonadota bacterium]